MSGDSLQRITEVRNRETRLNWANFTVHRERIRVLLQDHCPPEATSICVLGAGNANDLDLQWMAARFERVALVDLDVEATKAGVARQLGTPPPSIEMVGLDLTGIYGLLDGISASDTELNTLHQRLTDYTAAADLGSTFDCVLSSCLLSQLVDAVKLALGENHREFLPVVQAIRQQHLHLAAQLTNSKGLVAIVTDFVSSLTCPGLGEVAEVDLGRYAIQQIGRRNFFTGLNPVVLQQVLTQVLASMQQGAQVQLLSPWRWDLGPRQYLVTAVLARLP